MFHTYTLKNETHKYRYYVCTSVQKHGYSSCPTKSVNAQAIEDATIDCLRKIFVDNKNNKDNPNKQEIEAFMSPIWDTLYPQEKRRILKALIKEIDYDSGDKKLGIKLNGGDLRLEFDADLKKMRPLNGWHKEIEIDKEPKIRKNLILAYQLQKLLDEGKIKNLKQAATWLNLSQVRIDQIINMLLLSPQIQEEIISADNSILATIPEYKLRSIINKADWQQQGQLWRDLLNS